MIPASGPAVDPRRPHTAQPGGGTGAGLHIVLDIVVPLALYYGLRSAGFGVYFALLAGALASALIATVTLVRNRRLDGLAVYMMTTLLLGVGVSLLTGSPRFLLAKEGLGTLLDAVLRVLMAYTLPIDLVPALGTALYAVTSVVLVTVTNVHYRAAGVYDRHSALYQQSPGED